MEVCCRALSPYKRELASPSPLRMCIAKPPRSFGLPMRVVVPPQTKMQAFLNLAKNIVFYDENQYVNAIP